MNKNGLKITKG